MTQPSINHAAAFFAAVTPKTEPYDLPGVGTVDLVELRERDVAEIRKAAEVEKDATRRTRAFGYGLVVRSVRRSRVSCSNKLWRETAAPPKAAVKASCAACARALACARVAA